MAEDLPGWVDVLVRCADPECAERQPSAQPESDGSLRYYACACGMEFGYALVRQDAGTCAAGLPEGARLKFSAAQPPGVMTLKSGAGRRSVFLGAIGRRPE